MVQMFDAATENTLPRFDWSGIGDARFLTPQERDDARERGADFSNADIDEILDEVEQDHYEAVARGQVLVAGTAEQAERAVEAYFARFDRSESPRETPPVTEPQREPRRRARSRARRTRADRAAAASSSSDDPPGPPLSPIAAALLHELRRDPALADQLRALLALDAPADALLTAREVTELTRRGRRTVLNAVARGELHAVKRDRRGTRLVRRPDAIARC